MAQARSREHEWVRNRVSVITPVYNGEAYLHRLLDSILAQSWNHIEMILVDDGSQDNTLEIAQIYQEKFHERGFSYTVIAAGHRNASAAINRGLALITGEFLIWPDSDDELDSESIRKRVEFLRANPHYRCVRSLSRYLDEEGNRLPEMETRGDLTNERLFFPLLEFETFVCCGCYMLRTEQFFAIYPKRRIPEYDVGQNFQMLLPFMYFHLCPTIQEELYTVYVRSDSHSHRKLTRLQEKKKYADYEDMLDEIAAICRMRDDKELQRLQIWKQWRRYRLYNKYNKKYKAVVALLYIYRCRELNFGGFLWKLLGILCGPRIRCTFWKFIKKL